MSDTTAPAPLNDCWKRIGVWGDGACPELEKFIHCRNCPVYSAAAVQSLDVVPPAGYAAEWSARLAKAQDESEAGKQSVVLFRMGIEWFALPTPAFSEVAEHRSVHSLPQRRKGLVLGIVNVRGALLVCVSLGRLLQVGHASDTEILTKHRAYGRLLVVRTDGGRLAFPVDEVHGIHHHAPQELLATPDRLDRASAAYLRGVLPWGDHLALCLDEQLLFYTLNKSFA